MLEADPKEGGVGLRGAVLANTLAILERYVADVQVAARAQVKVPAPESVKQQAPRPRTVDPDRLRALARATPVLSPQSIVPDENAKVTDIRAPRLAGPIEQIHRLTLVEFRRLSKEPAKAVQKILDQVALLEEEGYDRKSQAVSAWRASPLYRQYLSLNQEALTRGLSVEDVIRQKLAAGEQVITVEDLQAILDLNAKLRF
jgi:hypothetical protein